jgi:hypothetical protein
MEFADGGDIAVFILSFRVSLRKKLKRIKKLVKILSGKLLTTSLKD